MANSLSMYSITENIYCSQLSSVMILLQPEPVSHRIIQGKDCVLFPYVLSSCGLLPPPPRGGGGGGGGPGGWGGGTWGGGGGGGGWWARG
jgi:hypothetical protein